MNALVLIQVVQGLAMLGQEHTLPEAIEASSSAKRPVRLSVNGCIILKSMLLMPQSACRVVTDALVALDSASLEFIAADPSGARVLETLLKVSPNLSNNVTGLATDMHASSFIRECFLRSCPP